MKKNQIERIKKDYLVNLNRQITLILIISFFSIFIIIGLLQYLRIIYVHITLVIILIGINLFGIWYYYTLNRYYFKSYSPIFFNFFHTIQLNHSSINIYPKGMGFFCQFQHRTTEIPSELNLLFVPTNVGYFFKVFLNIPNDLNVLNINSIKNIFSNKWPKDYSKNIMFYVDIKKKIFCFKYKLDFPYEYENVDNIPINKIIGALKELNQKIST